jgi:predicted ArsR family transcriptional regulator
MAKMTARQRVLDHIGRRNTASAAQIGQALDMSAATVRHHLSILLADGRIVIAGATGRSRPGRPEKIYRLSDRMAGENFGVLSDIALDAWLGGLVGSRRDAAIRTMAEGIAERMGTINKNLPAPKQVVQLIAGLNRMHYQARWEAGAEGPRFLFGHCPYAAIIDRHPELCTMDASLLSGQMGADVQQLAKIYRGPGGASQCVFAVRRPSNAGG